MRAVRSWRYRQGLSSPSCRLGAALLLALGCSGAQAHSPVAGIGHFYGGMLHPLLVPAHMMALIAAGLWLGQRWPANGAGMLAVMMGVLAGMVTALYLPRAGSESAVLLGAAVVGIAVAAAWQPAVAVVALAGAVLGILIGADSLPEAVAGRALWLSLGGTWLGSLLGLCAVLLLSERASRGWMKIGLRVVSTWVAAAAILVLALSWAGPRTATPGAPSSADAAPMR